MVKQLIAAFFLLNNFVLALWVLVHFLKNSRLKWMEVITFCSRAPPLSICRPWFLIMLYWFLVPELNYFHHLTEVIPSPRIIATYPVPVGRLNASTVSSYSSCTLEVAKRTI